MEVRSEWRSVLFGAILLAVLLAGTVLAATTLVTGIDNPDANGVAHSSRLQQAKAGQELQTLIADLERSVAAARGERQRVASALAVARDKLTVESNIVDTMSNLRDEMKQDASQQPPGPTQRATLAAKMQSLQLTHSSLQAATTEFDAADRGVHARLAATSQATAAARAAMDRLRLALDQTTGTTDPQRAPADILTTLDGYDAAVASAGREMDRMRATEAGLVNTAAAILRESADVAGLQPPAQASTAASPSAAAGQWQLSARFAALATKLAGVVGQPVGGEQVDPNTGDTVQQTAGGLMVLKKAANLVYFTDGTTTWVDGPSGLRSRPNDQLFDWERP